MFSRIFSSNSDGANNGNQAEGTQNELHTSSNAEGNTQHVQSPSAKTGAGILIRTLTPGDSTHFPKKNDTCRVHYEGFVLEDGDRKTKIDSSRDRKEAFLFRLHKNQVMKGWDIAVEKMSLGQKVEVTIPYIYAYGERGYPPIVPPRATLMFEIELIDFTSL